MQVGQEQSSQVHEEQESEQCSHEQVLWLQVGQEQSVQLAHGAGVRAVLARAGVALVVVAVVLVVGVTVVNVVDVVSVDDGEVPAVGAVGCVGGPQRGGAQWWQS